LPSLVFFLSPEEIDTFFNRPLPFSPPFLIHPRLAGADQLLWCKRLFYFTLLPLTSLLSITEAPLSPPVVLPLFFLLRRLPSFPTDVRLTGVVPHGNWL